MREDRRESLMIRTISAACAAAITLAFIPDVSAAQPVSNADPSAVTMSAADNRAVVLSLAQVLRERFAFHDRGIAAARTIEAMERRGAFREARTAAGLLALIDTQIAPVVDDRHFRVRYVGPEVTAGFNEAPPTTEDVAAFQEEVRLRGGEIPEVRWLAGNVGYLRVRMFLDSPPSAEKLAAGLNMLSDVSALIIDVRGAPGGDPAGVANAIGHLVRERTPTVRTQNPHDATASRTYYAEPRTPNFADRPVFVLIDKRTGSGAEEFAYDLQALRRATLIGQTTYGAATPGGFRPLAKGFAAFIPMEQVANTLTGANWEGVGVSPDVEVPSEQALTRAHRLALEAVLKDAQGVRREIAEEGLASLDASSGDQP